MNWFRVFVFIMMVFVNNLYSQNKATQEVVAETSKLRKAVNTKNESAEAESYYNIGETFYNNGNFPKSEEYFIKSKNIYEKLNDKQNLEKVIRKIAQSQENQNKLKSALTNYESASNIGFSNSSRAVNSNDASRLATPSVAKKAEAIQNNIKISEKENNKEDLAASYSQMADVNIEQNNIPKAEENLNNAYKISVKEAPQQALAINQKLPTGKNYRELRTLVDKYKLNTICQSGSCPNMGECWGEGTATFMILGNICTRSCGFCGVKTGKPMDVNWDEPEKVARSIKLMKIKHAVLTSVDRDDLKDMGSILWGETVNAVRRISPGTTMETLIPDFQGITKHLDRMVDVAPEVISHNMETVKRLTREVRIQAKYERSLEVLRYLKEAGQNRTKTGLMLGLGENKDEVFQTIEDIRNANVDVITMGQYLQPTKKHLPVKKFITPEEFDEFGDFARSLGFRHVESSPLVRSSYHAEKHIH
jgi:lipoyl synthase